MSINTNNGEWKIIGPGGGGGQFRPTISPHNSNTVLIACDMTGAYITHNGGNDWRQFNLRTRVDAFAFDPVNPSIIYAGSTGLFRSEDNGEKWELIFPNPHMVIEERKIGDHSGADFISLDNWPGGRISNIRIDREQTEHMYIAVNEKYPSKGVSIFFTRDRGKSFLELCSINCQDVHSIYVDTASPCDNRRAYIFTDIGIYNISVNDRILTPIQIPCEVKAITHAAWGFDRASSNLTFYITSPSKWVDGKLLSGVWKSNDLGQSWVGLMPAIDENIAGPESRVNPEYSLIAVCENDDRYAYLVVNQYPEVLEDCGSGAIVRSFGIVKTEDQGETWKWVAKGDVHNDPSNKKGGWVERNYSPKWNMIGPKGNAPIGIGASATSPEICYATDIGATYGTLDGGRSWEQVYSNDHLDGSVSSRGLDVTTCYGVHFDPFDKNHIAISYTDIGMFHSKDGGNTWIHGINNVDPAWGNTCYWMVFDPEVEGRAWSAWGYAHDLPRPKMYRSGYFHMAQGGVCKTDDGIDTWYKSNQGMPENSVTTYIVLDPKSPVNNRTLYAAVYDKGVYKSTDDGKTWVAKNNGIKGNMNAWQITMLPDGTLYLLVARGLKRGKDVDGAVYRSTDGANTWENVLLPKGVNAPNDLVFDPSNTSRMYLACWPMTIEGREYFGGVYATEDGGKSWHSIFDEGAHVYGIAVDQNNPSTLFINTFDNAAYRSDDRGRSWRQLKGYNFHWGHRPIIDIHNKDMIYLTTFGSSVWYGPSNKLEGNF